MSTQFYTSRDDLLSIKYSRKTDAKMQPSDGKTNNRPGTGTQNHSVLEIHASSAFRVSDQFQLFNSLVECKNTK